MIMIRPAREDDADALMELMRGEPLRPFDRKWQNFIVAVFERQLVGAVQIRVHRDGSREIGSLVVAPHWRGQGLASRLMAQRLADVSDPVYAITGAKYGAHYAQWGFDEVPLRQAPFCIALNTVLGRLAGTILARLQRRQPRRLVVLGRRHADAARVAPLTQTADPSRTSPG